MSSVAVPIMAGISPVLLPDPVVGHPGYCGENGMDAPGVITPRLAGQQRGEFHQASAIAGAGVAAAVQLHVHWGQHHLMVHSGYSLQYAGGHRLSWGRSR
jgi:hypothetical protein